MLQSKTPPARWRARRAWAPVMSIGGTLLAAAVLVVGCADEDAATPATPPMTTATTVTTVTNVATTVPDGTNDGAAIAGARQPVVLDYSPTISDAGALLYLASHPSVDLLAVTLPGTGEADCDRGVRTTVALLTLAGRTDVPVACGRDAPLVGDRDWPDEWRDAANRFPGVVLPSVDEPDQLDAELLLAEVLASAPEPVTVVAVGPLTNLGVVLSDSPELHDAIERVVVMGGAVDVPGNVEQAPAAEWNFYIDPEAVRRVFESGVPVVLVGLDATNAVPWTDQLVRRLATLTTPAGVAEHQVVSTRGDLSGVYLWDELAALAAVRPDLVELDRRALVVDDDGATIEDADGAPVDVAVAADATAAIEEFLSVLNGGSVPAPESLDEAAAAYLDAVGTAISTFDARAEQRFMALPEGAIDPAAAAEVVTELFGSLGAFGEAIAALEPPAELADPHAAVVAAAGEIAALAADATATVASAPPADFFTLLQSAIESTGAATPLVQLQEACRAIDDYGLLRGHAAVCGSLAEAAS